MIYWPANIIIIIMLAKSRCAPFYVLRDTRYYLVGWLLNFYFFTRFFLKKISFKFREDSIEGGICFSIF